jgi:hypothetical protein
MNKKEFDNIVTVVKTIGENTKGSTLIYNIPFLKSIDNSTWNDNTYIDIALYLIDKPELIDRLSKMADLINNQNKDKLNELIDAVKIIDQYKSLNLPSLSSIDAYIERNEYGFLTNESCRIIAKMLMKNPKMAHATLEVAKMVKDKLSEKAQTQKESIVKSYMNNVKNTKDLVKAFNILGAANRLVFSNLPIKERMITKNGLLSIDTCKLLANVINDRYPDKAEEFINDAKLITIAVENGTYGKLAYAINTISQESSTAKLCLPVEISPFIENIEIPGDKANFIARLICWSDREDIDKYIKIAESIKNDKTKLHCDSEFYLDEYTQKDDEFINDIFEKIKIANQINQLNQAIDDLYDAGVIDIYYTDSVITNGVKKSLAEELVYSDQVYVSDAFKTINDIKDIASGNILIKTKSFLVCTALSYADIKKQICIDKIMQAFYTLSNSKFHL